MPEPPISSSQPTPKIGAVFPSFITGFMDLPARIQRSSKPDPLKWYDRLPVLLPLLLFLWPLALVCLWLTTRFEKADKWRLAAVSMMLGCVWGYMTSFEGGQSGLNDARNSAAIADSPDELELKKVVGYSGEVHRLDTLKNELENAKANRAEQILIELRRLEPQRLVWKVYADYLKTQRLAVEKANEVFGDVAEVNGYFMEPFPYDPVRCRRLDYDIDPTLGVWTFHISTSTPKVGRIEIRKRIIRYLAVLSQQDDFQAVDTLNFELKDLWQSRRAKTLAGCEISLKHLRNDSWAKSSVGEKTATVQSEGKLTFAVDFKD